MAGVVLLPDFEFRFLLENAQKDPRMFWHVLLLEQREQLRRQLLRCLFRQRLPSSARHRTGIKAPAKAADITNARNSVARINGIPPPQDLPDIS